MIKLVSFFMLLTVFGIACNKDLRRTVKKEDAPQLNIAVQNINENDNGDNDDDSLSNPVGNGSDDSDVNSGNENEQISSPEVNEHAVFTFYGISGQYFGCSSTFKKGKEVLQFIFGTGNTTNLSFTKQEFEQLIHPGERHYGSLGAFTTYPQRFSDKVEIAYTDKQGRRWCSTRITEKKTNDGIETSVNIDQSDAEFIIEDAHKFEIAAETEGYRLKGKFECMLYEVNGKAKKKIKGDFSGVVAPQ
jgi:hypothetical protein